jgi:protein-disulfide isomerase
MEPSTNNSTSPAVPVAIIVGFALIAIAIFFTNRGSAPAAPIAVTGERSGESSLPRPVDETDYIRGNPNAPILMVEYSDYDCPFCTQYHAVMKQIMDEYGITGRLAWVYRQFPIGQLHPNAPKIAEAALCVGDIGGNKAFWEFTDLIFSERNLNEPTNMSRLPVYAERAGVSQNEYISCLNSGRMEPKLLEQIEDAYKAGAKGTPYTVLIVGNQQAVINGSQSYEVVKGIIENLLRQLDGSFDASELNQTQP